MLCQILGKCTCLLIIKRCLECFSFDIISVHWDFEPTPLKCSNHSLLHLCVIIVTTVTISTMPEEKAKHSLSTCYIQLSILQMLKVAAGENKQTNEHKLSFFLLWNLPSMLGTPASTLLPAERKVKTAATKSACQLGNQLKQTLNGSDEKLLGELGCQLKS